MKSHSIHAVPNPEDVLQHLDWVRSLAVQLVRDPVEADDLRQEVWLLSQRLSRPGRVPLKGWLSGLLRNVVRERRRASKTRSLHEESSGLDRALSVDTPPQVREVYAQQIVLERLTQLREPYRSTLIACYFENLSHAEIAERDGVSLHAIRSRVQRGLGELREDLADIKGGGTSALALLALTTWDPSTYVLGAATAAGTSAAPASAVGSASGASAALPIAFAALLGGGILAAVWHQAGSTAPGSVPESDRPALQVANQQAEGSREGLAELTQAPPRQAVPSEAAAAEEQRSSAGSSVRVIDLQGRPVPGIEVGYALVIDEERAELASTSVTDENGRATVSGIAGSGVVLCRSDEYHQVGFPSLGEDARSGETPVAVVGRRTAASGRVLTVNGEPVAGADVHLDYMSRLPAPVGDIVERSFQPEEIGRTAPDGTFTIDLAECETPMRLTVSKAGYASHQEASLVFNGEASPLEVLLERPTDPRACFGRVVTSTGEPIPGAWVADGIRAVRADEDGVFDLGIVPEGAIVWAGAPGFVAGGSELPDHSHDLEFELNGTPLRIEGRVNFPDGSAAPGLLVRIVSAAYAGEFYFYHGGRTAHAPVTLESFGRPWGGLRPTTVAATTDATGAFSIEGLLNRDYEIEFTDPVTLQRTRQSFIPAGTRGVKVEFPAPLQRLEGVVVSTDGTPLKGALLRTFYGAPVRSQGPLARTDDTGAFRFGGLVPGTLVHVSTELPWVHTGTRVTEERAIEIEVEPAALVQLTLDRQHGPLAGERQANSAVFLDQSGGVVPVVVDDVLGYLVDRVVIPRGSEGIAESQSLLVPVRARELVLSDEEGTLVVLPLALHAGDKVQLEE